MRFEAARQVMITPPRPPEHPADPPSAVDEAYARVASCGEGLGADSAAAALILAVFRRILRPAVRIPVSRQVRLRDHGSACLDPHQQGAPGALQPLHRRARPAPEGRVSRARRGFQDLGRDRQAVRRDDRRPLRGGHRVQLRPLAAAQSSAREIWRPVAYSFPPPSKLRAFSMASVHRRLPVTGAASTSNSSRTRLRVPGFSVPFRDLHGDARAHRRAAGGRCCTASAGAPRAGGARRGGGRILPGPQRLRGGPMGARRRQLRAVRRGAPERPATASTPMRCCIGSPTSTTCSVRRSPIFTSPRGSIIRPAYFCSASCRGGRSGITIRPSASTTSARSPSSTRSSNRCGTAASSSGDRPGAPGTVALGFTFEACAYHLKVIRDQPDHVVQMGRIPGRRGGDRQVPPGARDQPRGQHARQRHVLQPAARPRDVRPGAARGAVPGGGRQRARGRGRRFSALADRADEDHPAAGVSGERRRGRRRAR